MSVSRVVIPVLDLEQNDDPHMKVVTKGAKQISTQIVKASGTANTSEVNFQFQPPSQNTVFDRRIDLHMKVKLTLTSGTAEFNDKLLSANNGVVFDTTLGNGQKATFGFPDRFVNSRSSAYAGTTAAEFDADLIAAGTFGGATAGDAASKLAQMKLIGNSLIGRQGNNLALRQLPINSVIDNIDLTLNGTHFSTDTANYVKAVAQYTSPEYRQSVYSDFAHHPDTHSGKYSDAFADNKLHKHGGVATGLARDGTGRCGETPRGNVLNNFGDNVDASNSCVISTDRKSITFNLVEPLMISPLCMNYGKGLTNVNNIDISIKFKNQFNKILSYFDASSEGNFCETAVASGRVVSTDIESSMFSIEGTPELRIRNFTAQDDIKIPNEIILPYYQPRRYETTIGAQASEVLVTTTTNNRRLDQIPESLYVWVEPARSSLVSSGAAPTAPQYLAHNIADGNSLIEGINITFGNQVGILSGYNQKQLFELAIENGCDLTDYNEARVKGYCLKLIFGKDIPLADNESAGTRGDYNISMEVSHRNVSALNLNNTLNEMYINCGQAIVSPNECRVQTGLLDLKDNIDAENMGHHYSHNTDIYGAGLFSSLSKFAKKIPHLAKSVVKHAPHIVATGKALNELRKEQSMGNVMAAGSAAQALAKSLKGGSVMGGSAMGGSVMGGSQMGGSYRSRRN